MERNYFKFFFGSLLVLFWIMFVPWQYNRPNEIIDIRSNYLLKAQDFPSSRFNTSSNGNSNTTELENIVTLPAVVPPKANLKFGPPGDSQPEEEFERLWNYVYKIQFQCPNVEINGGRDWMYGDGGYPVCLTPQFWKGNTAGGDRCLVYSFGIGADFSFDDAMANKGCEVHSFDPSINLQDGLKRDSGVVFHKIGISTQDNDHGFKGWKMRTLRTLLKELGHNGRYLDYLKVDTDNPNGGGFEHETMQELLDTGLYKCVRQFGLEIHLPGPITKPSWLERCRLFYRQLSQLNERKYRSFAITDNVRADKMSRKNPNYSQMDKKGKMVKSGGIILWELAFVNFDPQPCQI